MQPPVATRAPGSGPDRRNTPAKFRDYSCFQPDGEVWCFCNTEPRIKAIRRVTRKESSPNLGREFWSCGNWVEGDGCGFFLWCDQAKRMGRDFTTPPPPEPKSYVQPTDAQRRRPSPPAFSAAPAGRPPPSPSTSPVRGSQADAERAAREVLHDFEDIDFDVPGNDVGREDEDDIVDDAESPVAAGPASPAKRPRFDSFTGPPSPQTPSKNGTAGPDRSAARQGFAAIQADPDSPFHALQKTLFSSGQSTSATTSASVSPDKSSAPTPGDPFSALEQALNPLASLFEAAKKEHNKNTRLLLAAKRKEETLRKTYEKERSERERFQRDNEALKNRIKIMENELVELRVRSARETDA